LICNRKDNYIVYLVLEQEDQSLEKLYKLSSLILISKIKQELQIKKENKYLFFKKVKQESKIKQEIIVKVNCIILL
jgi:hypothetical protein